MYPALQLLADEGLIVGDESGGRRTFSLTDAGREYVENNPEMARGAWEAMADADAEGGLGDLPRLFGEAARLGAAIAQTAHAGTPDQIRRAERLLKQTRRTLYEFLADEDTQRRRVRQRRRLAAGQAQQEHRETGTAMNMNDRMRISDSDRDRVAAQLRDYYAEGRLTAEELDERVTAALSAKTVGDLRRLMTDLPSPVPAGAGHRACRRSRLDLGASGGAARGSCRCCC